MPEINVLPKNVAELIAAGEVVDRPASVIKELVENAIDAKSNAITVEIQHGGITYIRITDNGCGISEKDVPKAFLRHATSKIKIGTDLDGISTLGFRGEALAAVCAVAKVEMLTATENSQTGTHYLIEGSEEKVFEETGCPKGTTITVKDIFYNTPARMKFLKKDVSEANACAAVLERIALSHPEISFRFIRDGKTAFSTPGDGNVKSCVYSVLGREFSGQLMEVKENIGQICVSGLICKPVYCRPTRNNQFTFLNGRLVRSGTVTAAVEQAYKNSAMIGKFPGFVLYVTVPFDSVDVNVHPAKTEVRFSDEKRVFDAVYVAVKNGIVSGDTRPEAKISTPVFNKFEHMTAAEYRQQTIPTGKTLAEEIYKNKPVQKEYNRGLWQNSRPDFVNRFSTVGPNGEKVMPGEKIKLPDKPEENEVFKEKPPVSIENKPENKSIYEKPNRSNVSVDIDVQVEDDPLPAVKLIGEAFNTYIVVQKEDSIFLIDKHAAHERIIFNGLKEKGFSEVQSLLTPVSVRLTSEEYDAVINNIDLINENGFEVEEFGNTTVNVRAVPAMLTAEDIPSLISEIAGNLLSSGKVINEKRENIFHSVSCKAAIKAGTNISRLEMQKLAEKVLSSKDIMYCPHGRPVAFEIKRRELEKQFGRIQ